MCSLYIYIYSIDFIGICSHLYTNVRVWLGVLMLLSCFLYGMFFFECRGVDLVLDCVGASLFEQTVRSLKTDATYFKSTP